MTNYKYVDTDYPEIAKHFKYPELSHVGITTHKKQEFICECCGNSFMDYPIHIYNLGNCCCLPHRDGIPYPEKFVMNLLNQCNIKYIVHYSPEWASPYQYDIYFELDNKKIIIEMDGGIGHGNESIDKDMSREELIYIDELKDKYAKENDVNLYRVNCDYQDVKTRFEFIKNEFIKEMSDVINLKNVDWLKVNSESHNSYIKQVIDLYKSGVVYIEDLSKLTNLSHSTIVNYLRDAMSSKIIPKRRLSHYDRLKDCPVKVIRDEEHFGTKMTPYYCYEECIVFESQYMVSEYFKTRYGSVSQAISKCNGYIKGKHICRYEDLPRDFDFKPKYFMESKIKPFIYQYSKDGSCLLNTYSGTEILPSEFERQAVLKVCNGKRKTYKGYKWSFKLLTDVS